MSWRVLESTRRHRRHRHHHHRHRHRHHHRHHHHHHHRVAVSMPMQVARAPPWISPLWSLVRCISIPRLLQGVGQAVD